VLVSSAVQVDDPRRADGRVISRSSRPGTERKNALKSSLWRRRYSATSMTTATSSPCLVTNCGPATNAARDEEHVTYTDHSSKKIRSDSYTKYLLEIIQELAATDELKGHVKDIVDYVGYTRYRGGTQLLDLAEFARREATKIGDVATVERLDDLVGHATGRIFSDDLNRKYQLTDNAREHSINSIELLFPNVYHLALAQIEEFLTKHPQATRSDVVDHLRALSDLSIKIVESRDRGNYRALRLETETQVRLAEIIAHRLELPELPVNETTGTPIQADQDLSLLVDAAQLQLRKRQVSDIRDVVEHQYSTEGHIHAAIRGSYWLFGGSYISEVPQRRRFAIHTEVDIPLLRPDGSLHVVELKRANISIIRRYRTGTIARSCVHEATSQVANYLRTFDEHRREILEQHGLEVRRATGTVVIGHPVFEPEFTEKDIAEMLRTYNSEKSRISVITYKELLDSAERAIDLSSSSTPLL
jgi:hypothetical protein